MTDNLASQLVAKLAATGQHLVTAESCTGGLIAAAITGIPGSSQIFERGFVTYSNQAKQDLLGVSPATLASHGAVSGQTAAEMVAGALAGCPMADYALAVTGIAGPGGGTRDKPVGLVYLAVQLKGADALVERHVFSGDRAAVRGACVSAALAALLGLIANQPA